MAPQARTTRRPSTPNRAAGRTARPQARSSRPTRASGLTFAGRTGSPSSKPKASSKPKGLKRKAKSGGGVAGKLSGVLSALPVAGKAGKGKKSGGGASSKAKPAVALLATGAGALLGRQQLNKRKQADTSQATPVVDPPVTTPAAGIDTPPPTV